MNLARLEVCGHQTARGGVNLDAEFGVRRYSALLATMLGIPSAVNDAVDSAGYTVVANPSIVRQALVKSRTQRGAPFRPHSALVVLDGCRHDAVAHGQPTTVIGNAFKHGLRAAIARHRLTSVYDCDDVALTYTGSWGASVAANDFSGAKLKPAGANGDYVELAVPAGWQQGYGVLGCEGSDDNDGATFTVTVDGVNRGALDIKSQAKAGTASAATLRFLIPSGATTIRVTVSNFATIARFNYLGLEVPSNGGHDAAGQPAWNQGYTPPIVLVCLEAKPNSWGATGLNDGVYDAYSGHVLDVVQEFSSPYVIAADLDGMLQKGSTHFLAGDTLAPNQRGHILIASVLATYVRLAGAGAVDLAMLAGASGQPPLRIRTRTSEKKLEWLNHQDTPVGSIDEIGWVRAPGVQATGSGYVQSATEVYADAGDVHIRLAGKGLKVKEGANAKQGVATLVAGTVTVANTSVTANSRILLTIQSLGTVAAPKSIAVTARVAGASFTITSEDATDTSVIAYQIFEPA